MTGFVIATLGGLILGIYFIVIQYYLLLIEMILVLIALVACGFEILLGFFSCWQFQSYEKQQ